MTPKQPEKSSTLDEIRCAVAAIEEKKGEYIRVLDLRNKSSITDYIILATGTANPHLKAMKSALSDALKEFNVKVLGKDREVDSGWIVVDAFDFMIHLQTAEMRDFYQLEHLWKDASIVEI